MKNSLINPDSLLHASAPPPATKEAGLQADPGPPHQPGRTVKPPPNPLARWIGLAWQREQDRIDALARERLRLEQARARFAAD